MHFPDLHGGLLLEAGVVETDVDARAECLVECTHAVGGQEQDTLQDPRVSRDTISCGTERAYTVVFHCSQKHGDNGITFDISLVALLQEDIGLVQQQHTSPLVC